MKIIKYDERPQDEKELLSQIERDELLLGYCRDSSQKLKYVNNIAFEFSDLCSKLCKVIKRNLLKESLRN